MKFLLHPIIAALLANAAVGADSDLHNQAKNSLRKAVEYFRTEVAFEGTYLWQYSADLSKREGEGVATQTQGWVKPPGTPAVGLAFLTAWAGTGDFYYLEAARETAYGLIKGQLRSGGWTYVIDSSPAGRKRYAYRDGGSKNGRNVSTLDDNTTQSAVRFLVQLDRELKVVDERIRESIEFALTALLKVQYPNGAWSQGFEHAPESAKYHVAKANFPVSWQRKWPGSGKYWFRYTFNDNSLADTIELMFLVDEVYSNEPTGSRFNKLAKRSREAAEKAGSFILLAQMPEPQPAWAQQYNFDMQPSWARKFEPPAVTGGESQGVLRTLLMLYRETGDAKFLDPIPRAIDYLQRSRLPNGKLARFYELNSNLPLYFTRDYQLTYDDSDIPTHYSFKVSDNTDSILRDYERLKSLDAAGLVKENVKRKPDLTASLLRQVRSAIKDQDDQGRWIENGPMRYHRPKDPNEKVINVSTFNRNVELLAAYLSVTTP